MNSKNASRVIGKKIKAWKDSLPEGLKRQVEGNVIVTGGAIASLLLGEDVNDFDIYFRDQKTTEAVARHYVSRFLARRKAKGIEVPISLKVEADRVRIHIKSAGIAAVDNEESYRYFEGTQDDSAEDYVEAAVGSESDKIEDFDPVFLTENAITLKGKVQLVCRFFGEPDQIHGNYDFVHCTNYWWDKEGEKRMVLRQDALEALLARELRYVGSLYPVCSVFRLRKFINRGWTVNAGQILKMCMQISELDLADLPTLQEQLVGVDAAYFNEIINLIKKEREKNPTKNIDSTYIAQLVERIF